MRYRRVPENRLNNLVQQAVKEFAKGKHAVTITLDTLLKLKPPKYKPVVYIKDVANKKMRALVDNCQVEIAWHGVVRKVGSTYIIDDILVYPQTTTAVTVESNDDEYPVWLEDLSDEQFNNIRMQGHSHVNMDVSPSATDEDFYDLLTEHVKNFYIFIIMNKRKQIWINIHDIEHNRIYESSDISIQYESVGTDYDAWYAEQYKKNITQHARTTKTFLSDNKFGYSSYFSGGE